MSSDLQSNVGHNKKKDVNVYEKKICFIIEDVNKLCYQSEKKREGIQS